MTESYIIPEFDENGNFLSDDVKARIVEMIKANAPAPAPTTDGPPGPESMLVVGPGRPDDPTTTGHSDEQITALPVGCEYRSTDGASVGAWVWRKRPEGWVVTEGDTGWVDCTSNVNGWSDGECWVRRTESSIFVTLNNLRFESLEYGFPKVTLPSGFWVDEGVPIGAVYALDGGTTAGGSYAWVDFQYGFTINFPGTDNTLRLYDSLVLPPSSYPSWPDTLTTSPW